MKKVIIAIGILMFLVCCGHSARDPNLNFKNSGILLMTTDSNYSFPIAEMKYYTDISLARTICKRVTDILNSEMEYNHINNIIFWCKEEK